MNGLLHHLWLTLRLNFRSKQALVYGYVVPIFFLLAFGSIYRVGNQPLLPHMGQLLTVTVLGGACFGMPTAMVAERERGVWRRYRLLPTAIGGIILSTMVVRFVIVVSAALLQLALARWMYGTFWPAHPLQLFAAFTLVCFAFLGLGLVIAMLADNVPSVQALGQAIFLPMIIIGGVGVSPSTLPPWAQHVARFLPGIYSVDTLQVCMNGIGLPGAKFGMLALTVIGLAALLAGAKMFRWDVAQRLRGAARGWVGVALGAWVAIGFAGDRIGNLSLHHRNATIATTAPATVSTGPTTLATTAPAQAAPLWEKIGDANVQSVTSAPYENLPDDRGTVTPVADSLDNLDENSKGRVEAFADALTDWKLLKNVDTAQRVRYMLSAASMADLVQDPQEAEIPFVVFEKLREEIPKDQLIKICTYLILYPDEGKVVTNISDLGIGGDYDEGGVRERVALYAQKLLYRLLGKVPK